MPKGWSKGFTKETHPSILKISQTMRERKINNFSKWQTEAKRSGKIPSEYPAFKQSNELAFLIGLVLGDGNIYQYQRTQGLRIALGTDKPELWQYAVKILASIFRKTPTARKVKNVNCMVIDLYQKQISQRLGIPIGDRGKLDIAVLRWILANEEYILNYLKGLYEAEGSFCVHKPTGTYKLLFSNRNQSMLRNVMQLWEKLGFHPHQSGPRVQLSRKVEAYDAVDLIKFRKY